MGPRIPGTTFRVALELTEHPRCIRKHGAEAVIARHDFGNTVASVILHDLLIGLFTAENLAELVMIRLARGDFPASFRRCRASTSRPTDGPSENDPH